MPQFGDPSIITNQPGVLDIYATALKIKQMRDQMQFDNGLKWTLSQPGAIDPATGTPTVNTLAQIAKMGPQGLEVASKLSEQSALAGERKVQEAHLQSETQVAQQQAHAAALKNLLDVRGAELASGNTSPDVADNNLKSGIKDYIDGLSVSPDTKASMWAQASAMTPVQLQALANKWSMSAEMQKEAGSAAAHKLGVTAEGTPAELNVVTGEVEPTPQGFRADSELGLDERVRHDKTEEKHQAETIALRERMAKEAENTKPNLSPEAIKQMGDQLHAGDRTVLQNVGRGKQGAADLAAIRNYVAEAYPDDTGQDLANIDAAYKGQQAGEVALGRRGALLEQAGIALNSAIDQSRAAYAKLPRTQFVPYNKLQKMVEEETASPEQAAAFAADQFVINAWGRAINPTGVLTVESQKRGADMLSNVTSQQAHDATLEQMRKEVEAERTSTPEARSNLREPGQKAHAIPKATMDQFHKITDPAKKATAIKRLRDAGYDTNGL